MNKVLLFPLLIGLGLLSACSTMNSKFSCNATAGDACMSMEEVDARTEDKDIHLIAPSQVKPPVVYKTKVRRIWVAPYADKQGIKHREAMVYVPELSLEGRA